jgi:hypothetical protein
MAHIRKIPIVVWPILAYIVLTISFALSGHVIVACVAFVLISLSMFGVYVDPVPQSKKSAIGDILFRPLIGIAFIIVWMAIRCMWLFGLPQTMSEDIRKRHRAIKNSL